jgi:hypothetical protein
MMAAQDADSKWIFCSDVPLGEYSETRNPLQEDRLDFKAYANVLAQSLMNSPDPVTLGIYGNSGTGKTTLMQMIRAFVDQKSERFVTVWFNAWQYDHEDHPIVPLIVSISRTLEEYEKKFPLEAKREIMEGVGSLTNALQSLIYGFCVKHNPDSPDFSMLNETISSESIMNQCLELTKDYLLAKRLYMDAFEDLRRIMRDSSLAKPGIVIFIDDIDQCHPDHAISLLQGINLILKQPGISVVLGICPSRIHSFLKGRFAKEYHVEDFDPDVFLQKIVQVPFYIPDNKTNGMISYIRTLVDKAEIFTAETSREKIDGIIRLLVDAGENNPRNVVHLLNSLQISVRMADSKGEQVEPISLFFSLILNKEHYHILRVALEQYITVLAVDKETPIPLGGVVADILEQCKKSREPFPQISRKFQALAEEQSLGLAKQALTILAQSQNLCQLLSSEPGLRWLKDPEFRSLTYKRITPTTPGGIEKIEREHGVAPSEEREEEFAKDLETGIDLIQEKPVSEVPRSPEKSEHPKRVKHQEEIDPLFLLIPLTLMREQFKKLKAALDQDAMVISSDKKTSKRLSKAIANTVEKGRELNEDFQQTSQYILKMADFQPEGLAQKGLRMLAADPLLCQIFSTPQGIKWLRDPNARQVNWEKIPVSQENLLELGFQHWEEILVKVERAELEPQSFLLSLTLAQSNYQVLRIALRQGAAVIQPEDSLSYKLGTVVAGVLEQACKHGESPSETAQYFVDLAEAQSEGLGKNALVILSEKSNLYDFLSLDYCLEWLRNPEGKSADEDFHQEPGVIEQEESAIFLNEIRRKVIDEGVDPLSIHSILDDIKRNEAIPEFAKPYIRHLQPLKLMTDLLSLSLRGCNALNDLTPLGFLTAMKKLDLMDCAGIINLNPIASLVSLEWLELTGCRAVSDLEPLRSLASLKRLCLSGCAGVIDLNPLMNLQSLEWLDLTDCRGVVDLRPLENLHRLQWVDISGCSEVSSIEPLRHLKTITRLYLNSCTRLADIEPLEGLGALKGLYLKNCTRLTNLRPLVKLRSLEIIDLTNCTWVRDLSPLVDIPSLQRIRILGTGVDINGIDPGLRDKILD